MRDSVLHVCAVSACAQFVRSTRCMWTTTFFARGELCESVVPRRGVDTPHPNPKGRRTPTARCLHTHLLHHRPMRPLFHQPFRGGRSTEDPGAPLLSAVCVSPSPWHFPGSGAVKIRKKLRGYPPGWETTCGKCLKLHAANLSTWRVPRNSGSCRKTAQIPKLRGNRRSPERTRQPEPGATEAPASRRTSSTNAGTRNGNQHRTNTKPSTGGDERGQTLRASKRQLPNGKRTK